eukprot:c3259_g1_i1.p1 GENE.c3259_g1_i1~~c3259_g1_i1.p1  ORF type:complete len:380 (-),score=97.80 c3259_g1_i1:62-1201(-)
MSDVSPLSLELPPGCTQINAEEANEAWLDQLKADWDIPITRWQDAFDWCIGALEVAHDDPRYKKAVLRILGNNNTYLLAQIRMYEVEQSGFFEKFKAKAQAFADSLGGELAQYYNENDLNSRLGSLGSDYFGHPVFQHTVFAPFFPASRNAADAKMPYDEIGTNVLLAVSHIVNPLFQNLLESVASASGATHRSAPPKTLDRATAKTWNDYADLPYSKTTPSQASTYLLDTVRGTLICDTTDIIWNVFDQLKSSDELKVCRVKNTYADSSASDQMQQILVNAEFHPNTAHGTPLTFADLYDELSSALSKVENNSARVKSAHQWLKQSGIADTPVVLIVECQIYQPFYIQKREITHLPYKLIRAENLRGLADDCRQHGIK